MSANPGDKPKFDLSAVIARAIVEQNREAVYEAVAKALLKGNAYVFKELAGRACSKIRESVEVSGDISILADRL
jgi:hypothetical protein